MRQLFAKHLLVGVGMRIDVDQPDRAMSAGDGAQHRQRQGVVATKRQRRAAVRQDLAVSRLDAPYAVRQAVGVNGDVPQIGHLQPFEWGGAGAHVVGADHHRLLADLARAIAGAAAIGGADIQRNADKGGVQTTRLIGGGQAHHGGETGKARHVVAALGLVQHGVSLSWACDKLKHLSNIRRLPR